MTRCVRGRDARYRDIYSIVLEANRAAIAAARPGLTCGALDKVARDVIRRAGYGRAFGHSLGHGVGYEIHEEPTARAKSKTVLEPGMFVTIEPGIYLEVERHKFLLQRKPTGRFYLEHFFFYMRHNIFRYVLPRLNAKLFYMQI